MEEEAKAVQEVAKTAGKAIDAAREAGGFVARYIAGPLEEGIGIFHDRLKYMRWERQARLIHRAEEFMKLSGLASPTRPVPLKLAIPILQGAVLEDDDGLQDRWAILLVNAANAQSSKEIRRAYVSILEQLTPVEARILDAMYALPFDDARHAGISTSSLPDSARILSEDDHKSKQQPNDEIALALGNLVRLGCAKAPGTWGGGESFASINPTTLGRAFVDACTLPKT